MSYYEKTTDNFFRMTDELWSGQISQNNIPDRPSWTSQYLLDNAGNQLPEGPRIPGILFTGEEYESVNELGYSDFSYYPNPASAEVTFAIPSDTKGIVEISIYDLNGRMIKVIQKDLSNQEIKEIVWNPNHIAAGTYLALLKAENKTKIIKLILIK
jgi:hypothetical protein